MTRHTMLTRRTGYRWAVWCSCGWTYRYQTKKPADVYAMHADTETTKGMASLMSQTPRDYRGGGR